jgi:hypothetical protein
MFINLLTPNGPFAASTREDGVYSVRFFGAASAADDAAERANDAASADNWSDAAVEAALEAL